MFFISGITGKVGGAAARRLLAEGRKVRALVRDPNKAASWSEQGVELHEGDFTDPKAMADALEGVEGAFLMIPPVMAPEPGFPEAKAVIDSLVEAVRQIPPPRVAVLSSIGSEQTTGLGMITTTHVLEQALIAMPVPMAFVRAGSFLENYAFSLAPAEATGYFDTYLTPTDRAVPMVATVDIGNQIAELLMNGWKGKKIVELGTDRSPNDLARAMSLVLGKPIEARWIPREKWSASLEAQGIPAGRTGAFEEMQDGLNSGWIHFGVPGTESVAAQTLPEEVFANVRK